MYKSGINSDLTWRRNVLANLSAVAFVLIVAVLAIGSYQLRLANVHDDNGAVFYSYLYEHQVEFARDAFGAPGVYWLWGSICFWAPVLAHKYFGLDPRVLDYLFYLLQDALLGLSVFLLTHVVSRSWLTAFGSMALAIMLQPWSWNLAAYGSSLDVPLYTTLAQSLATLAGAAFLAKRWNLAWLLAIAIAIIHPVILSYLLAMLMPWMWLNRADWRAWLTTSTVVKFALLLALCGVPFLIQARFAETLLSPREHWESVSKHMHSVPWGNYPSVFRDLGTKTLAFILVLGCCWPKLIALPTDQRRFLLASAIGTVLLGIVQVIGIELKLASIALAMGLRAFSNFILFAWPFAFAFLFSREVLRRFYSSFALLLAGLIWYRMVGGIPVLQLILFALAVSWPESLFAQRRRIYFAILATLPLAFIMLDRGNEIFLRLQHDVSAGYYLLALLVSAAIADFLTIDRTVEPLRRLAVLGLLVCALVRAQAIGAATRQPAMVDLKSAEIWARDHTPPGTMFMTITGWRTLSQRPAAMLMPGMTQEVYTPFRYIRARNEFLFQLYGISGTWRNMGIADINAASWAGYLRLKEPDFSMLAGKFGATFLVRPKDEPALDFPLAYQNGSLRIYRVVPPQT